MRLRLAPGYEALEARVREAVAKHINRGSVTANLNVKRSEGAAQIRLNEAAVRQVLVALDRLKAMTEVAPARAEALLGVKGVLEVAEPEESEAETQIRSEAMLASLATALDAMVRSRQAEGGRLKTIVLQQLERHRAAGRGCRGFACSCAGGHPPDRSGMHDDIRGRHPRSSRSSHGCCVFVPLLDSLDKASFSARRCPQDRTSVPRHFSRLTTGPPGGITPTFHATRDPPRCARRTTSPPEPTMTGVPASGEVRPLSPAPHRLSP